MPPRKLKPKVGPVVVGTVSTRSTRRQSIVNIAIPKTQTKQPPTSNKKVYENKSKCLPKSKVACKISESKARSYEKSPPLKEQTPACSKSPPKRTQIRKDSTEKTPQARTRGRPRKSKAVLEILKDWSDDESSQTSSGSTSTTANTVITDDKQMLISILEGDNSPDIFNVSHTQEESVIEECVVDDGSCIILEDTDTEMVPENVCKEEIVAPFEDSNSPNEEDEADVQSSVCASNEHSVSLVKSNSLKCYENSTSANEPEIMLSDVYIEESVPPFKKRVNEQELDKVNVDGKDESNTCSLTVLLDANAVLSSSGNIKDQTSSEFQTDDVFNDNSDINMYDIQNKLQNTQIREDNEKQNESMDIPEETENILTDKFNDSPKGCLVSDQVQAGELQKDMRVGSDALGTGEIAETVKDMEYNSINDESNTTFSGKRDSNLSKSDSQHISGSIIDDHDLTDKNVAEGFSSDDQVKGTILSQNSDHLSDKQTTNHYVSITKVSVINETSGKEENIVSEDSLLTSHEAQNNSECEKFEQSINQDNSVNSAEIEYNEELAKNAEPDTAALTPMNENAETIGLTTTENKTEKLEIPIQTKSQNFVENVDTLQATSTEILKSDHMSDDNLLDGMNEREKNLEQQIKELNIADGDPGKAGEKSQAVEIEDIINISDDSHDLTDEKNDGDLINETKTIHPLSDVSRDTNILFKDSVLDEGQDQPDCKTIETGHTELSIMLESDDTMDKKIMEIMDESRHSFDNSLDLTPDTTKSSMEEIPEQIRESDKLDFEDDAKPATIEKSATKCKPKISKSTKKITKGAKDTKEEKPKFVKVSKIKSPKIIKGKNQKTTKDEEATKEIKSPKDKAIKDLKKKKQTPPKKLKDVPEKKDKASKSFDESLDEVRRSSRIKSITVQKKNPFSGLMRSKSESQLTDPDSLITAASNLEKDSVNVCKDVPSTVTNLASEKVKPRKLDPEVVSRLKQFVHLKENSYKTDRQVCKEAKKMVCDCFLSEEFTKEDEEVVGCGDDCLNRLLLIECGNLCPVGDKCTNKKFQKTQFAPVEVFNTEKKGLGLRAAANIPYGEFILEYVGEVLDPDEFDKRAEHYSTDKNIHYYFMSLRSDAIIDATMKGNISRFINHSCDPNAETQKWTVNGELRIGFFSTRTILAGEEITFDYRFQRYGKEAQKCYCEAATCRGWLGEEPDEDESEEEEEEEIEGEPEDVKQKLEISTDVSKTAEEKAIEVIADKNEVVVKVPAVTPAAKKKTPRRKPRKDVFEDMDLEEEIEMLVATGLKNQAHTLKLSRLMVRSKEPEQRQKLLRTLRRGELPCRRLFLDYHGLRLMHGYMIDAQQLASRNKKYESLRLELLQTLAVLPIPNKTMLQDSKVLPTVEKWATNKNVSSPLEDSDSNSPRNNDGKMLNKNENDADMKDAVVLDQEEEIKFLASKLVEEWSNLKEIFKIPKRERIVQMKEHEREANRKFLASSYGQEQDTSRKSDHRYRTWSRFKSEKDHSSKKGYKPEDKDRPSAAFLKISKHERRKLFALQMEVREEERRKKQREMWREHELNCMMLGTDPRFTAPFDPNRGYQCIWNPTSGQWQNYPLPQTQSGYGTPPTSQSLPLPSLAVQPSPRSNILTFRQPPPLIPGIINPVAPPAVPVMPPTSVPQIPLPNPISHLPSTSIPPPNLQIYQDLKKDDDPSQVKFAGPIPPPAKLPPKWKCGKDKYGRPYYYHIKLRKSQWEPPPIPEEVESSETSSSSDTSSITSDSSDNSDSDDEIDDTQLLLEVKKQMEKSSKLQFLKLPSFITQKPVKVEVKKEEVKVEPKVEQKVEEIPSPMETKIEEFDETPASIEEDFADHTVENMDIETADEDDVVTDGKLSSIDIRLKEVFKLDESIASDPPKKKRRVGLCDEIVISPRTEEAKVQSKEDLKRYKANKEKLRRQKELIIQEAKKQMRESCNRSSSSGSIDYKKMKEKRQRSALKSRMKEMNSEQARRIKETFRTNMATTVVSVLNAYRKPDCKEGRIVNTEDFKHLARKLTHFVMLKEIKHLDNIEDLICTDGVKGKARDYIKKYMSKFGETYQKRHDEPDFKD